MVQSKVMPEKSFRIYKGIYGWCAESRETVNGQTWDIMTMKRATGVIACVATAVTILKDNAEVLVSKLGDSTHRLVSEKATATEAKVAEVHRRGLLAFDDLDAIRNRPANYEIKVGQMLVSYHPSNSTDNSFVVCAIDGTTLKCIDLEDFGFYFKESYAIKDIEKPFGIGTYYVRDQFMETDQLLDTINKAEIRKAQLEGARFTEKVMKDAERAAKIEIGRAKLPAIPEGVKAVIVAELRQDESDIMTDYFAHKTTKVVYLAFSGHTRDLFKEMRKAALNSDVKEIRKYSKVPDLDRNGRPRTEQNKSWWAPADEHREKYSMGDGYYLGDSKYSGWVICKDSYSLNLEAMQIAIAEGRFFIPLGSVSPVGEMVRASSELAVGITIEDYSEKAVVVRGNTKVMKEKLLAMGGRFNPKLTGGPGWIFSRKVVDQLKSTLHC